MNPFGWVLLISAFIVLGADIWHRERTRTPVRDGHTLPDDRMETM